jgi:hypothetical protein
LEGEGRGRRGERGKSEKRKGREIGGIDSERRAERVGQNQKNDRIGVKIGLRGLQKEEYSRER